MGERQYFIMAARQMDELGWDSAARAARRHLTSRLHALTLIPRAVATRNRPAVSVLAKHVFGRMPRTA